MVWKTCTKCGLHDDVDASRLWCPRCDTASLEADDPIMRYKSVCSHCGIMSTAQPMDGRNGVIQMYLECGVCGAHEAMRPLSPTGRIVEDFKPNLHELPKPVAGPSVVSAYRPESLDAHASNGDMAVMRANFAAQFFAAAVSSPNGNADVTWAVAEADALLKELCK